MDGEEETKVWWTRSQRWRELCPKHLWGLEKEIRAEVVGAATEKMAEEARARVRRFVERKRRRNCGVGLLCHTEARPSWE